MNDYVYVGKIVNTFGIKGEVKVLSDFEYQERIFKNNFPLYVGFKKAKEIINSYRMHKNFVLLTFKGYTNINEILKYKGENIYILRSDLKLNSDEYLLSDLIGMDVYDENNLLGVVIDYEFTNNYPLLKVKGTGDFYIPLIAEYILEVNLNDKKIMTNKGKNLMI